MHRAGNIRGRGRQLGDHRRRDSKRIRRWHLHSRSRQLPSTILDTDYQQLGLQIDNALAQGGIEPSSVRAEVLSAQWQLKNSVMLNVHVISFWQDPKADVVIQKLRSRMPVYKGISPSVPGTTLSLDQQPIDIGDYAFLSTEQVKGWIAQSGALPD